MKLVSVVLLSLGGIAIAQPTEPGAGTTDVNPQSPPSEPQPPPPRPEPPAPPPPPVHTATPEPVAHDDGIRPNDLAFAIGLGYARPVGGSIDLQTPNIASVRLRLISGVTFEPVVTIANSSHDTTDPGGDSSEATTELEIGSVVRFPVIRHGRVDFEILGSLGLDVVKENPTGDYNTQTTTTFGVGWGIGIGYWLGPHWQLSASATNPLLQYVSRNLELGDPDLSMKESTSTFAVEFNPTVTVMLHLYN